MRKLFLALPVMGESVFLPRLMQALSTQTMQDYKLVVCINQPEIFWNKSEKKAICENNQLMLRYLRSLNDERIEIIDKSSMGCGWDEKKQGVGWARKLAMDEIAAIANSNEIMVSIDADTVFNENYLQSIQENFSQNPKIQFLSVPYFHPLSGDANVDSAILRYEIYMRTYAINLFRIGSPYCFTALGSAIALRVAAYKRIGGITPKQSGEDFYFLQKLVKTGQISHWNDEWVYPSARLSDRVAFGTGQALINGTKGNWSSYPIYPTEWFEEVEETYNVFPILFTQNIKTPLDDFFIKKFGKLPWDDLRANFKTQQHFVRSCHEKLDGLRILQYLKERQRNESGCDTINFKRFLQQLTPQFGLPNTDFDTDLNNLDVSQLDVLRNYLVQAETYYRKATIR